MDINPYEFEAPWEKMEFATFCYEKKVDLIIFPTAWTDHNPDKQDNESIMEMINYWGARMEPFLKKRINKNIYLLAADRIGKEKDTTFVGCSCVIKLCPLPSIVKYFDKKTEGGLLVCLNV